MSPLTDDRALKCLPLILYNALLDATSGQIALSIRRTGGNQVTRIHNDQCDALFELHSPPLHPNYCFPFHVAASALEFQYKRAGVLSSAARLKAHHRTGL